MAGFSAKYMSRMRMRTLLSRQSWLLGLSGMKEMIDERSFGLISFVGAQALTKSLPRKAGTGGI